MKTLILYASASGATEECARMLQGFLPEQCDLINLKEDKNPASLEEYDTLVLGSSIRAGKIRKPVKTFIETRKPLLLKKNLGLFVSTLTPPEKATHYIEECFPSELVEHARARGLFGGKLDYNRLNFLERFIMKRITKSSSNVDNISKENIEAFARALS